MEEENKTDVAYLVKNKQTNKNPRPKQMLCLMMKQSSSAGKTELRLPY